jgi:vancomycin permeability regulator SanA
VRRLLVVAPLLPALLLAAVWLSTASVRFDQAAQVPPERVALVFGAGVRPDGQPSPMLAGRVQTAVSLYLAGKVDRLLMTGDNSRLDYDEVSAMKRYAVGLGVAAEDVALDHAGFSTYESCYRARAVFGLERAVLVTQAYHLPRALYTCRGLGLDAVGLGAPDWGTYSDALLVRYSLREAVATLNALWQVHVARPEPTFLGPPEIV